MLLKCFCSIGIDSISHCIFCLTEISVTETFQDPNILAKELVAKNAFLEMDANQDGVVSLEEFLGACLGQSELCQLLALKAIEIFAD